jgi:threonyl-tRNA synthetase
MDDKLDPNDHREIGKVLDLFHLQEEAMGGVFWHHKGWTLFRTIENYIRRKVEADGYQEVKTPQLIDRTLWEKSGHWEKYRDNMFTTLSEKNNEGEEPRILAVKPMNCPGHIQIFNHGITSYRELPIRMAEFGSCHRNEPSGALHGIMRVRAFTQDDAHIFCRPSQVMEEAVRFIKLTQEVYRDFGFDNVTIKLSTRPPVRAGDDADWDTAENGLIAALNEAGLEYELQPGEGAFYGPKIEFTLTDVKGRQWQCGTLQYDMVLPKRLNATYVEEDGTHQHPIILHRAILGSLERFIGMLLEHHEGNLPFWLSPTQIGIVPVGPQHVEYAQAIAKMFSYDSIRATVNADEMHFNKRIKGFLADRVPYVFVVGDRDQGDWKPGFFPEGVSVRKRGEKDTNANSVTAMYHCLRAENRLADPSYRGTGVKVG